MALKQEIEVLLFWKEKPISLKELMELTNTTEIRLVKEALIDLIKDYELRNSGLHIISQGNGYLLEARQEYLNLGQKISPINLKTSVSRTLALIALKEPIKQSEVIKERGSSAYDHIRELVEKDWISKEKEIESPSSILTTSPQFKKHFSLSKEGKEIKLKLKASIKAEEGLINTEMLSVVE